MVKLPPLFILKMKRKKQEQEVPKIPSMPVPFNLGYSIKWWTSMSINGIEGKKGSFNLDLYMSIRNRELYNYHKTENDEKETEQLSFFNNLKNHLLKFFSDERI